MNWYQFQFIFLPAAGLSCPEASAWKRQIQDGTRESQELMYQRKPEVGTTLVLVDLKVQVGFSLKVTYELKYEE